MGPSRTFVAMVGPTRVRVRITGSGEPLLMIMGIGGNLEMWTPLAEHLVDRELIMFDFPGTGGSGPSWLPPTMGANALLIRLMLSRLGYSSVDGLGYSWGGMAAQHFAVQHARSVRSLVLAATTFGLGAVPPGPVVTWRMLTPRRYYSREYFTKVAPAIYGGRFRTDPQLVNDEAGRRLGRPPGLMGYAAQLAAVAGYSSLPILPLITAPTLILAGEDDPIVAPVTQRVLTRGIRHSRLQVVPGNGHLFLLESPEVIGPIITDFLTGRPT